MTSSVTTHQTNRAASLFGNLGFNATAAIVAAVAAGASAALGLPVWAMFIGWIAFFTRGLSARDGAWNLISVLLGIAIGMAASLLLGVLGPLAGAAALPVVVFGVAMVVLSTRTVPGPNNILAWFLGLVTHFAAHLTPSVAAFAQLGSAALIGSLAGWCAHALQRQISHR